MSEKETTVRRCMLYSPEAPTGRIFTGEEAISAAESDGWVDSPDAVGETKPKPAAKKRPAKKKASKSGGASGASQ